MQRVTQATSNGEAAPPSSQTQNVVETAAKTVVDRGADGRYVAGIGGNKSTRFQPGHSVGTATRFGPGNQMARSNKHKRRRAGYHAALLDQIGGVELAKIGLVLYQLALKGDVSAAKVLLDYAVGRPLRQPDPDEWETTTPSLADAMAGLARLTEKLDEAPAGS